MESLNMKCRLFALSLLFCSGVAFPQNASVDSVRSWMHYLAGDAMRGRGNGSAEMRQAARFIAAQFSASGLRPLPGQESFFQAFQFKARGDGRQIDEQNVIGFLEGSHPTLKKECIVVCAHYDHLGIGPAVAGDSIYNGADDNASGCSAVLGIAQRLSALNLKPARSMLFITWAGEELGMQGSRHYVKHPLWPLEKTAVVINFELLGRPEQIGKQCYYLTGAGFSTLAETLSAYNENSPWQMENSAAPVDRLMFASDNASFAAAHRRDKQFWGVVAHTFAMEAGGDHVHRPHDDPALCDHENLAAFIDYMTDLVMHLAAKEAAPQWTGDRFLPIADFKE